VDARGGLLGATDDGVDELGVFLVDAEDEVAAVVDRDGRVVGETASMAS